MVMAQKESYCKSHTDGDSSGSIAQHGVIRPREPGDRNRRVPHKLSERASDGEDSFRVSESQSIAI